MRKFYYILSLALFTGSLTLKALPTESVRNILERADFSFLNNSAIVNTPDENSKFILYVNGGTLYIKYGKPQELVNGEVIVFNLLGQEVARKKLENESTNQIGLPVKNTCYVVKINYSGKVHTQKVVVSNN